MCPAVRCAPTDKDLKPSLLTCEITIEPFTLYSPLNKIVSITKFGALLYTPAFKLLWSWHNFKHLIPGPITTYFKGTYERMTKCTALHSIIYCDTISAIATICDSGEIHILNCKTGTLLAVLTHEILGLDTVTHITLGESWIIVCLQLPEGQQQWRVINWSRMHRADQLGTKILDAISIGHVTNLSFDCHQRNLCWITSSTGVFSIDVSLPATLLVPIKITLDALQTQWPFTIEYRQMVFKHNQLTMAYHELSDEQKIATHGHKMAVHDCTQWLRQVIHSPVSDVPFGMAPMSTTSQTRLIYSTNAITLVNRQEKTLYTIDIPPHYGVCHTTLGSIFIVTQDLDIILYKIAQNEISCVVAPIPNKVHHQMQFCHAIHKQTCIYPAADADDTAFMHLNGNTVFLVRAISLPA